MKETEYFKVENYKDYKDLIEDIQNLSLNIDPLVVIPKLTKKRGEEEIAINIAHTLSLNGNKVLFIDCDFENTNIYRELNISKNFGLYDILKDDIDAKDIIINIDKNLDILTSGHKYLNLLDPYMLNELKLNVLYFKKFYDYIVLDMPKTFKEYINVFSKIFGVVLVGREKE